MAKILTLTLNPALDLTIGLGTLRPGQVNRSQAQHSHAAGKGLNVAQVLADLGHSVTVGGFLGGDNLQPFEALIETRGFADCFVRVAGETRSNIKLVEADGRVTDINGQGPQVDQAARDALLSRLAQVAPGHDAVVVAGSLPRGVSAEWFQQLLEQLKAQGLKVALDSSGEALRAGLQSAPWLVKPNTEELGEVLGEAVVTQAQQGAAAEYRRVSRGSAGTCATACCTQSRPRCGSPARWGQGIPWSPAWCMACCRAKRPRRPCPGPPPSPPRPSPRLASASATVSNWLGCRRPCN